MYNWDIALAIIIGLWVAYTIAITIDNNKLRKEIKQLKVVEKKYNDLKKLHY